MFIITIQSSFEKVIESVKSNEIGSEKFWLARRLHGANEPQQFFTVNVSLADNDITFEGEAEDATTSLKFHQLSEHDYKIDIIDVNGGEEYHLRAPKDKYEFLNIGKITLSDLSTANNQMYLGDLDGSIYAYDASTRTLQCKLQNAYYSSINRICAFPSGKVLLSVGDYYSIKLWDFSAEEAPKTATRSFVKHTKPITDVALIGRGRNFASSSEDGSVILWECSTGGIVSTFRRISNLSDPAKCLTVARSEKEPRDNQFRSELLYECEQVVVFVGYELGVIQQYSVARNCPTDVRVKHDSAVTSICSSGDYVVAGFANGHVLVWNWVLDEKHSIDFDPTQPVEHLHVMSANDNAVVFQLSNGAETLLSVRLDVAPTPRFSVTILVGFDEMFEVNLVGTCVSTAQEVAIF